MIFPKPKPIYSTTHKIWKILFDQQANYAVLEVRDEEMREAFLVAIDWVGGEVLWDEGYLEEEWWFSLAGVANGKLFTHLLHDDQEPSPKALLALDIEKAEGIWEVPETTLLALNQESLHVSQSGQELHLSMHTGEVLAPQPLVEVLDNSWKLPSRYLEGEPHFTTVSAYLNSLGKKAIGAIDYWESDSLICIGFYEIEGVHYRNDLLVLNRKGEILLEVELASGGKGIGTESFGIIGDYLFYICNKQVLERIKLA